MSEPDPSKPAETQFSEVQDSQNFQLFFDGDFNQSQMECMLRAAAEFSKVVKPKHTTKIKVAWETDEKELKGGTLAACKDLKDVQAVRKLVGEQHIYFSCVQLNAIFDQVPVSEREGGVFAEIRLYPNMEGVYNYGPGPVTKDRNYDLETIFLDELLHTYLNMDGFKLEITEQQGVYHAVLRNMWTRKAVKKSDAMNRWYIMLAFVTKDDPRKHAALLSIIDDPVKLASVIMNGEIYFRSGKEGGENIAKIEADEDAYHLDTHEYPAKSPEWLFVPHTRPGFLMRKICDRLKRMIKCIADMSDSGPFIHANDGFLEPELNEPSEDEFDP